MRHESCYCAVHEMQKRMREQIRKWEREVAYERGIVCSVPPRSIVGSTTDFDKDDRWKPG